MSFKTSFHLAMIGSFSIFLTDRQICVCFLIRSSLIHLNKRNGCYLPTMVIIEQIIPFHVCVLINIGGIAHIYADPADIHGFKHS